MSFGNLEQYEADESSNTSKEVKESQKESSSSSKKERKAIARLMKQERKIKAYDMILVEFIKFLVKERRYDALLKDIFSLVDIGVPSHIIVGILSIVHSSFFSIVHKDILKKSEEIPSLSVQEMSTPFSDTLIQGNVKTYINIRIENLVDMISLLDEEIPNKKTLLQKKHVLIHCIGSAFQHFLYTLNIIMHPPQTYEYGAFIFEYVVKYVKK